MKNMVVMTVMVMGCRMMVRGRWWGIVLMRVLMPYWWSKSMAMLLLLLLLKLLLLLLLLHHIVLPLPLEFALLPLPFPLVTLSRPFSFAVALSFLFPFAYFIHIPGPTMLYMLASRMSPRYSRVCRPFARTWNTRSTAHMDWRNGATSTYLSSRGITALTRTTVILMAVTWTNSNKRHFWLRWVRPLCMTMHGRLRLA